MKNNSNHSEQRLFREELLSFIFEKCKHFHFYLSQAKPDMEINMDNLENDIKTSENGERNLSENIYMNPQEVFKNNEEIVMPDAVKNGTAFSGMNQKSDFEKRMSGEDVDNKNTQKKEKVKGKEKVKQKKEKGSLGVFFYSFALVIVVVSLITLKIDMVSNLVGAGALVFPLSLIFMITKKKSFFWYSIFTYLSFIVVGVPQKALFASLGILFASLIFGGIILYHKDKENVDSIYGLILYLTVQVFIIRFFTSFLNKAATSPAMIYNLLYISSVLLFTFGVVISKNKKDINNTDDLSIRSIFWLSVGSIMMLYGLIINCITKNKSFTVLNMIVVSIVTAINIWIVISSNMKKEVRNIWVYYDILVFIQALLRPLKMLTAVITFACAIVMVVSMIRGFVKKQKSLCQNGILVFIVLLIWIIVVDTHDYNVVMRGLVDLFCVIVAFTSIVLYNLLGKRIFGSDIKAGTENTINRDSLKNVNESWMPGGYNQNNVRPYGNNYMSGNVVSNGNMNMGPVRNYSYANGMPNGNMNMGPVRNYSYANGMPNVNMNMAPGGNYAYGNGMPNVNMNMAPGGNYTYGNGMPNVNMNMAPGGNYTYGNGMSNANMNMGPAKNYSYANGMPNGNMNMSPGGNYSYANRMPVTNQNMNNN